jgi:drug/metabolite transporter (DMT)-like permease
VPDAIAGIVVAAALLSACLHAAWNAAVKASDDARRAMTAQVVASGLLAVPILFLVPLPPRAALPWLCGSVTFNLLTCVTLLRGYAHGGGFGLVYPLARATSPLIVLCLARALHGETVGLLGTVGVALVSSGIAVFAYGEGRHRPAAFGYALLAGGFSAAYAVCDANGARVSSSVLGYGLSVSIANAVVFGCLRTVRDGRSLARAIRAHVGIATLGSVAATASYVLILWVWSRAPIALGAALRDTSIVFATLIAIRLGERLSPARVAAIALVAGGACLIRFA